METKLPLTTKDMNTSSLPRPTPTRLPVPGSKIKAPAIKRSRSPEDKSLNQTVGVKRSRIEPVATSTPRAQGSFKAPTRPAKVSAARQVAQSNNRRGVRICGSLCDGQLEDSETDLRQVPVVQVGGSKDTDVDIPLRLSSDWEDTSPTSLSSPEPDGVVSNGRCHSNGLDEPLARWDDSCEVDDADSGLDMGSAYEDFSGTADGGQGVNAPDVGQHSVGDHHAPASVSSNEDLMIRGEHRSGESSSNVEEYTNVDSAGKEEDVPKNRTSPSAKRNSTDSRDLALDEREIPSKTIPVRRSIPPPSRLPLAPSPATYRRTLSTPAKSTTIPTPAASSPNFHPPSPIGQTNVYCNGMDDEKSAVGRRPPRTSAGRRGNSSPVAASHSVAGLSMLTRPHTPHLCSNHKQNGALSRSSSTSSLNSTRPATRSNSGSSLNATTHVGPAGGANTTTAAPKQGKSRRPAWDLKGRLQDMEQQLNKRDAVSLTLQGQLDNNNARIALLESQNQLLSGTVAQKEQQTSAISEEIRTVERRLRDKEDELDSVRRRFEREQDDLRRNHERAVDDLKFKTSTLERQKESLEAELRASQQENSGLKSTVAQLMSSQAELAATKVNLEQSYRAGRLKDEEIASLKQTIADQIAQLDEGQQKMREHETMRRKLHNTIQELKGNIRVFCRVRPLLGDERLPNDGVIQHMHFTDTDEKVIELDKLADVNPNESLATSLRRGTNKYEFSYDRVFPPACGQSQVFEEISQLVQSALDGYNVCIFAYGQTGSGKTYTMEGPDDVTEETMGMIPRAVEQIFCSARDLTEKGWQYKFTASFLEIYNETIRDLLGSGKSEYKHEIRMVAGSNEVMVADLTLVPVTSETQVAGLLKKAGENRAVAETKCNERSSRSHSVFQLKLMGSNELTGETCQGLLSLVDLAGSERLKDSGSEGLRLKEAQSINKSLSNLGNVIMALGNKENHVPYRNSKLTYLLQNSLGGNSKTLMFVNVSPKEECFHETLCSLRFATKVNQTNIGTAQKKVK